MRNIKEKRSAFTLIEILIALAIFSFALVIVTGIFSSVLGNQTLISSNSEVSRDSQRIMKQMTDDIKDANTIGAVKKPNGSYYSKTIEGFLFIDANKKIMESNTLRRFLASGNLEELNSSELDLNGVAAGIALFSNKGIKIYFFNRSEENEQVGDIEYAFIPSVSELEVNNSNIINVDFDSIKSKLNSDQTEVDALVFWGFGCYQSDCNLSPYAQIVLTIRTKNYDQTSPNKRSIFGLKTRISKRTYAN